MPIRISIDDVYELTKICDGDEERLLEIANQPNFLCAPLNARKGKNGKLIPVRQSVEEFIEGSVFDHNQFSAGCVLAIREKNAEKHFMGAVGITGIMQGEAELGYFLAPELHGKRIIVPAIHCALRYATQHWGVTSLRAEVDPENDVSLHILKKLGFEQTSEPVVSNKYCNLAGQPAMRQDMKVNEKTLTDKLRELQTTL
jgi:RimJ/RimL family protein N-acetyltransferase